jgi:type I restriction enzyme S subunit
VSLPNIPDTWALTQLGSVTEYGRTSKAEPDEIEDSAWVLELEDIEKDTSKLLARMTFAERQSKSTKNKFEVGDVLYGKLRPYLNKIIIADQPGYCTTEVIPLKSGSSLDNRYLFYWLKHPAFLRYVEAESHGMNMPRLGTDAGKAAPFVLASLNEQKRIADKLDAVLARVDACRNHLDRIPTILKRFRQSVLAAATSGKLTEVWRKEQQTHECARGLISEIEVAHQAANIRVRGGAILPALSDLPDEVDLPESWVVAGFDAMAAPVGNALKAGPFGSALKKNIYVARGYKIYGQEQVIAGDESLGDYFIDEQKYEELSSCAVTSGDILISLVGTIGRVLILSDRCADGIINPRLVKLSLYPSLNREFVSLYLQSPLAQNFFKAKSHGGTMDILNLGILRELPILLPPITEQTEIVRRVESLFAYADRLEARHTAARAQVEKLTPATLAKAFRGELVPQDPNDEPASLLLERIRTKHNDQSANKSKRGRQSPQTTKIA